MRVSNEEKYKKIAVIKVQEKRNIVISEYANGGYTIANQLVVREGNHDTVVFLKGGFHFDSLEDLYNLRDGLNIAIKKIEES